jgi:hypothetical protein
VTIYATKLGEEVVVCDGCGIAQDGTRPDLAALRKINHNDALRLAGLPAGTTLNIRDYCPPCRIKRGDVCDITKGAF